MNDARDDSLSENATKPLDNNKNNNNKSPVKENLCLQYLPH